MRRFTPALIALCSLAVVLLTGCSGTKRALVHEEDMAKVFPWPNSKDQVSIRVKPQTTMARAFLIGSWQEVVVTAKTTFFMVDKLGKKFAYTPARSPIRRLATVDRMEIRWPMKVAKKPEQETDDAPAEGGQGDKKADGAKAESKPDPAQPGPKGVGGEKGQAENKAENKAAGDKKGQ